MTNCETTNDTQRETLPATPHWFATIASLTERGGRITHATGGVKVAGLTIARVGDIVTYEDGSEAVIVDGAGEYAVDGGQSLALVGSRLSNGDRIVESLQRSWGIEHADTGDIKGFLVANYVPTPPPPCFRLAVRGATTARGGVLREPSGAWEVSDALGDAGTVGDLIHYVDGSTAKVVSGLGLPGSRDFKPLAFVGSRLDNGDTITDSPEREGSASPFVFTILYPASVGR